MANSNKGKVIGVISFKGGVGKTTSSINIASSLSKLNRKTIIVDSNFSSPNLHVYLGLLNPEITLREVLNDKIDLDEAIYEHKTGLHVLPSHFHRKININAFREKINELRKAYEFVIIDSSPALNEEMIAVLMVVDELIIVTTPDYPTLLSTLRAAEIAKSKNLNIRGLIINKKRNKGFELKNEDIEKTVDLPIIASLNDDSKFAESTSRFTPLVSFAPRNKNAREYKKIAHSLSGDKFNEKESSGFLSKFKRLFMKKERNQKLELLGEI